MRKSHLNFDQVKCNGLCIVVKVYCNKMWQKCQTLLCGTLEGKETSQQVCTPLLEMKCCLVVWGKKGFVVVVVGVLFIHALYMPLLGYHLRL